MSNSRPRRSIWGGVLAILAGTLLLVNNFAPEMHLGRWLADYWPALLILWGLAKLFDYLAARRAGEPAPRSLTGGQVFLLLLLLGVAAAAGGISDLMRSNPDLPYILPDIWGQDYSFSDEITRPAKPGAQVRIFCDRGDISVRPEEAAQIRVLAKKTVKEFDESSAQKIARKTAVIVSETPDGYEVKAQVDAEDATSVRMDLEVHVPKTSSVQAKTRRGKVQVAGLAAPVTVTALYGDIELRDIAGDGSAELAHGDARVAQVRGSVRVTGRGGEIEVADVGRDVTIQGEFWGPIRANHVPKEIHFLSQRTDLTISQLPGRMEVSRGTLQIYDTPGNVAVTTRNKDITLENVGGRIRIENRRGNVEVRLPQPPQEELDVANESGSVELVMPPKCSFELSATSRQGDVESDFQGPELKTGQEEKSRTLQGKFGGRGPKIQLRTSYGNIRLRKGS